MRPGNSSTQLLLAGKSAVRLHPSAISKSLKNSTVGKTSVDHSGGRLGHTKARVGNESSSSWGFMPQAFSCISNRSTHDLPENPYTEYSKRNGTTCQSN